MHYITKYYDNGIKKKVKNVSKPKTTDKYFVNILATGTSLRNELEIIYCWLVLGVRETHYEYFYHFHFIQKCQSNLASKKLQEYACNRGDNGNHGIVIEILSVK